MKSVLIAEDHPIVRLGVANIVQNLLAPVKIVEVEDLNQVVRQLTVTTFELLILDINIPGGNNLQMVNAIRLRQPRIKILIFTAYDELLFGLNYIQAGADGYLVKTASGDELTKAINMLLNNEKYLSSAIKEQLLQRVTEATTIKPTTNPLRSLSAREMEVTSLLIKGTSINLIAQTLNLQITTISTYKNRVFEKLGISNVIELSEKVRLYSH
jgi:two-component system invasion response regulator UvrY